MEAAEPEERTGEPERCQESACRWALHQSSVQKPGHRRGRLASAKILLFPSRPLSACSVQGKYTKQIEDFLWAKKFARGNIVKKHTVG